MKASELIQELQKLIDEHGDLRVVGSDGYITHEVYFHENNSGPYFWMESKKPQSIKAQLAAQRKP